MRLRDEYIPQDPQDQLDSLREAHEKLLDEHQKRTEALARIRLVTSDRVARQIADEALWTASRSAAA